MFLNLDKIYRQLPLEVILLIIAISANLIKDLLNPDLVKFIERNKFFKYFILFLIAIVSSSVYTKNDRKNILDPLQLIWALLVVIAFYLVNKLNYKVILGFALLFIMYYSSTNIINYYKKYYI